MIELLTTEQMAEADRLTIAGGGPSIELMERAGRAVADGVTARWPAGAVTVVCGPGNNGGDGFIAGRVLSGRGHAVRMLLAGEPEALKGDAAEAARRWDGPITPAEPSALSGADIIIDAVFGAGLARPLEGTMRRLIEAITAAEAPVLAVDLPSGIQGNTGAVMGAAVRVNHTVTFFRRKPAHLLLPGRIHCGQVTVADIGIAASVLEQVRPQTFANAPALWRAHFPEPRLDGHKYSRGHAVVLSGGLASTGAARLAARGALRAGAGLVTLASPREALAVNAAGNLAIMVRPVDEVSELATLLADRRLNSVLLGPGGGVGEATRAAVEVALADDRAVVLDADALTSFAGEAPTLARLLRARPYPPAVLTPHQGEFSVLFKGISEVIEENGKLQAARAAARYLGAVLLLKGPDTVVAAPDGRAAIAENAPPWLATAGSGDVLAGMIAGLLAQGMPPFEAATAGVWLHGEAGAAAGPGLISEDLPEMLPQIYRRLIEEMRAN